MIFSNELSLQAIIMFAIAVVFAIVLHECAHGYVAKWNGDLTAKFSGRLTLNPLKHFDVFGFMMLMVVGFGYAKPVPINPDNFKRRRLGIFLVSIAGIMTNLILAFLSALVLVLFERFYGGVTLGADEIAFVDVLIYIVRLFFTSFLFINICLALFNLLPIYPLDGHRILESATGPLNKVTKTLRDFGQYILIVLIVLGALSGMIARSGRIPNYPEWMNPLGFFINTVGGAIRNCLLNFWRLLFGVQISWV